MILRDYQQPAVKVAIESNGRLEEKINEKHRN
jgi:hypothetical protein